MDNHEYELYHHGVKGMKWGVRKKKDRYVSRFQAHRNASKAAKESREADIKNGVSSISTMQRHATLAKAKSKLADAEHNQNLRESRQAARKTANKKRSLKEKMDAVNKYRNKYDDAEKASDIADAKWNEVSEIYKSLGKTAVTRILNAARGKSEASKNYSKAYDEWEKLQNVADAKWEETNRSYIATGRNRIDRVLNNINYDRKNKR